MRQMTEIRWHGRGGQGAKTAALLLADVAFNIGMHVQGFPEYGPERMGAPITAYDRISAKEIRVHSNIYEPDFVAVVDETLLHSVDVTKGLKEDGAILINTQLRKEQILPLLNGYKGKVYVIDARKVCMQTLGKYFPNTPMLAAMVKISEVMEKRVASTMAKSEIYRISISQADECRKASLKSAKARGKCATPQKSPWPCLSG